MKCPICNVKMLCVDSRQRNWTVRRRHECPECLTRLTSSEAFMLELANDFIVKQIEQATGGTLVSPTKEQILQALDRGNKPIYKVAEELGITRNEVIGAIGQGESKKNDEE